LTLIGYIKQSIEILIDLKVQERLQERETKWEGFYSQYGCEEGVNEYEKLLRKLESDIRNYIKVSYKLNWFRLNINSNFMRRVYNLKMRN
jgi:hypothetical protein